MSERRVRGPEGLYAARRVDMRQSGEVRDLMTDLRQKIGSIASIRVGKKLHLSMLYPSDLRLPSDTPAYSLHDASLLALHVQSVLDREGHGSVPMTAEVDDVEPFYWVGRQVNSKKIGSESGIKRGQYKFALKMKTNEQMLDQRGLMLDIYQKEFGENCRLRELEPHVTIGCVRRSRRPEFCGEEITTMLPSEEIIVPHQAVFRGISVHLDDMWRMADGQPAEFTAA